MSTYKISGDHAEKGNGTAEKPYILTGGYNLLIYKQLT